MSVRIHIVDKQKWKQLYCRDPGGRMPSLLHCALLALPLATQSPGYSIREVALTEVRIEEGSLSKVSGPMERPGAGPAEAESKSLEGQNGMRLIAPPKLAEMDPVRADGLKIYGLLLRPGETLEVLRTTAQPDQIAMKLVTPARPNALSAGIFRVNHQHVSYRSRRIEITNPGQDPRKVLLLLYGRLGTPYTLEFKRRLPGNPLWTGR